MMLRPKVIWPIFRRNFASYFSGVLGFLFIVVFVAVFGFLAFSNRFFNENEPSLDQLTQYYPLLLLFFIPAITMSVWADERKLGTDELLFTMPAMDIEILLGKYLSVLAVYTVALLFSTTCMFVLGFLGDPDWGLILTTYFGYWVAGAALLSAGMVASILTTSMTVAFVLGVLICTVPVFIGFLGNLIGFRDLFYGLSLSEQFRDFGMGVIPPGGLVYFIGFTVFMLYLNLVLMARRHWSASKSTDMGLQYGVRAASLAIALICVTAWAGYAAFLRVDATNERLFSLSPVTTKVLKGLDSEQPIVIQAFLSPEVPSEYAQTRKQLVGLLRQFDQMGGKNLEVRYVDVKPFSVEAEEAEHFGIEPVTVSTVVDGHPGDAEIFLGVVVISSFDKVVVPFFDRGLPIEYELTRSVDTVATEKRLTVGILTTDAQLMGGRNWQIVTELEKQYKVEEVMPAAEIDGDKFDVLLAPMPSSLTDPEMANLVDYVRSGKPVLVFDDPVPLVFSNQFGVTNAPRQPKPRPGGPMAGMMGGGGQSPPKAAGGQATPLLDALGIRWPYDQVVFDLSNPHPGQFALIPKEYLFIGRDNGNENALNGEEPVTRDLQEIVGIYAGVVSKDATSNVEFTPLLSTGPSSGVLAWDKFMDEGGFNPFSMQMTAQPRRDPERRVDDEVHHIAARITSDSEGNKVNAIFVADIDMISDVFFELRSRAVLDMKFDNVSFVLNAVDELAGDDTFIELRSRRARHRTLTRFEEQDRKLHEQVYEAEKVAEDEAKDELEKRQKQLTGRADEIRANESLDPIAKEQMLRQAQQAEQQQLTIAEKQIEQRKRDKVRKAESQYQRKRQLLQTWIRFLCVFLPPIPALCVGLVVFLQRWTSERRTVASSGRSRARR